MRVIQVKVGIFLLVGSLALSGCSSSLSSPSQLPNPVPSSEIELAPIPDTSKADEAACSDFKVVIENLVNSAQKAGGLKVEHFTKASVGIYDARRNQTSFALGLQLEELENSFTKSALELQGFGQISASTIIENQNATKTLMLSCE